MTDWFLFRRCQWTRLSSETPFDFLTSETMTQLGVNFKDCCRRLWRILALQTSELGGLAPEKCAGECGRYTCVCGDGLEERLGGKMVAAVDVGGKVTWVMTTRFVLRSHVSMMAVPKVLKCLDCDTTFRYCKLLIFQSIFNDLISFFQPNLHEL